MRAVAAITFVLGLLVTEAARSEPLVADISDKLIAVTTGFSGAEVLLFGATDGEGDVIVLVRGPESRIVVRRKQRVGAIWVNGASAVFPSVPSYYHLATTRPVEEILPTPILGQEKIGLENLNLSAENLLASPQFDSFRAALIRNQQKRGLYLTTPGSVAFLGNQLFSTRVTFPANVSTGRYSVDVLLVRDGSVVSRTSTPLEIRRQGFEAGVFEFAHKRSALYGLIAILVALVAGWLAGLIFRKV